MEEAGDVWTERPPSNNAGSAWPEYPRKVVSPQSANRHESTYLGIIPQTDAFKVPPVGWKSWQGQQYSHPTHAAYPPSGVNMVCPLFIDTVIPTI